MYVSQESTTFCRCFPTLTHEIWTVCIKDYFPNYNISFEPNNPWQQYVASLYAREGVLQGLDMEVVTIGRKLSWIILWLKSRAITTPRKINMEPEKKLPGKGKSSEPKHHFQVRFVHLRGCIQNSLRSWENLSYKTSRWSPTFNIIIGRR